MSNPFSTRFTRPGAIGYLFPPGQSSVRVLELLRNDNWWGEIIGTHGSGKTSLLSELLPLLEAAGRRVAFYNLHQGDRRIHITNAVVASWNADAQIVVDGYEQLAWWSKRRLQSQVKAQKAGMLITAHQPMGLPPLFATQPTLALAQQIVAELQRTDPNHAVTDADVAVAFTANRGNLREMLFSLYDVFKRRQAASDQ
jgi:hypothetical protein